MSQVVFQRMFAFKMLGGTPYFSNIISSFLGPNGANIVPQRNTQQSRDGGARGRGGDRKKDFDY